MRLRLRRKNAKRGPSTGELKQRDEKRLYQMEKRAHHRQGAVTPWGNVRRGKVYKIKS